MLNIADTFPAERPVRGHRHQGPWEHYCQHRNCVEWGALGFDDRRRGTTAWFCYEHKPADVVAVCIDN